MLYGSFKRSGRNCRHIETLESRRMLANVSVTDEGLIIVNGTSGDDKIGYFSSDNLPARPFVFDVNGEVTLVPTAGPEGRAITGIQINGRAGDDHIRIIENLGPSAPITLSGDAGDDRLFVQDNVAFVIGGPGNDVYELKDEGQFSGFSDIAGNDTLHIAGWMRRAPVVDMNQYPGLENLYGKRGGTAIGNDLDNKIRAITVNTTVLGMGGNDTLFGSDSDDRLEGGDGHDVLIGNLGEDLLLGGAGNDLLLADHGIPGFDDPDNLDGGDGKDTATSDADDVLSDIEVSISDRPPAWIKRFELEFEVIPSDFLW